jgi:dTDP-4-dehydrorhamnose 3,5-epimerase
MIFTRTELPGVVIVDCDVFADERGLFARAWMPEEFRAHGLDTRIAQCSLSFNKKRGTIRGLHHQIAPYEEIKLVRTIRGAVFDVAVDLRRDSPTFRQWVGVELSADNRRMLYIPEGLAHGYQTLTDDAELFYFVSTEYSADHQRGVRWNDPAFGIDWPLGEPTSIHDRDRHYGDFQETGST